MLKFAYVGNEVCQLFLIALRPDYTKCQAHSKNSSAVTNKLCTSKQFLANANELFECVCTIL